MSDLETVIATAQVMLVRSTRWSWLKAWAMQIARRRGGSAERQMLERELTGLRYSYEDAGPIIEDLDPFGWGGTCRPLPAAELQDQRPLIVKFPFAPRRPDDLVPHR